MNPSIHRPLPKPKGLQASLWAPENNPPPSTPSHNHHRGNNTNGHHHSHYQKDGNRKPYGYFQSNSTAIKPHVPYPATPPPSRAESPATRHSYDLARFEKIAKRLNWKLFHLSNGWHRATADDSDGSITPTERAEREVMFKLDFYEFYMLLERALVHLLSVFDVEVSSEHAPVGRSVDGKFQQSNHSFHKNVLAALSAKDSALGGVLGRPDVFDCLARAKELRNRWKYMDDEAEMAMGGGPVGGRRIADHNIELILETIIAALEEAYKVAVEKVTVENRGMPQKNPEVDWNFMDDAMDWEAVWYVCWT